MRKRRLNQILSVLLMPYREKAFFDINQDIVANSRYSFSKLKYRVELSIEERQEIESMYYTADADLQDFLSRQTKWYPRSLDDFRLLLDLFFQEEITTREYRKFEKRGCEDKKVINLVYLRNIYRMAESLMTFRDGKLAIRTWNNTDEEDIFDYPNVFDKVEIWNLLGRMIAPDILIVAFYLSAGHDEVWYLSGQTDKIMLADTTLAQIMQKGIAETHMHFNAGISFRYMWQRIMEPDYALQEMVECNIQKVYIDRPSFIYVLYRVLWAEFLESSVKEFETYLATEYEEYATVLKKIFSALMSGKDVPFEDEWRKIFDNMMSHWHNKYGKWDEYDFLAETVYRKYKKWNIDMELLFLFQTLKYLKRNPDKVSYLHLFMQYIRCKNIYMGQIVQGNQIQGLDNFQIYYRLMRYQEKKMYDVESLHDLIFRDILSNPHLDKVEIRMIPQLEAYEYIKAVNRDNTSDNMQLRLAQQVYSVLNRYQKMIKMQVEALTKEPFDEKGCAQWEKKRGRAVPMLGVVYHFQKQNYVDNRIADDCWVSKEEERSNTKHLLQWRYSMIVFAEMLENIRSSVPGLNKFVVGLDAASNENQAEPWIFAPVYMRIRNRRITKPRLRGEYDELEYVNNIGFTFHVGEDFRHILSGLRHVDEVVQHFKYKAGDRLGHALALSVDVEEWTKENEVVVLPIIEYLEDLLWLWGKQIYENWSFMTSTEVLEGKILKLARDIEHDIHGMTVHMLYNAYQQKFSADYEGIFKKVRRYICPSGNAQECTQDVEHFCKNYNRDSVYGVNWTEEKVFCTYFCPVFTSRMQKPIMINVDRSEIDLFRIVQNNIVKEVERKGIYVEANPTSNLSIGEVPSFHSKHLLALNSKDLLENNERNHEVLITINSDDPLTFNTNTENELAYVYHALTYQGYNKESVLRWIDKIRQMGLDSSFIKRRLTTYEQLREIQGVLKELEQRFPGIEI